MLDRAGRKNDAVKAWRAGLRKNWPKNVPVVATSPQLDGKPLRDNFGALLHFEMLASLTGELTLDEGNSLVEESMGRGDFLQSPIVKYFDRFKTNPLLSPEHVRSILLEIYRSPMAREFARKEAFLELSLTERFNMPLVFAVEAEIRLDAIPEANETELAGLIHEGLTEIALSVQEERVSLPQLMMMMMAWTGQTGFVGWTGFENSLRTQRNLRGRIAYVYGRRFLVLKERSRCAAASSSSREATCPRNHRFRSWPRSRLDKLGAK